MLSPSLRQVTHALLTRPPLSYISASRRINQCSFVRLECVKHAASVHPEPGSNSLNIVFIHRSSLRCLNRIQSFFLSFFLLFVLCVQSSLLTRFLVFFVVVLFSKTVSPSLSETAWPVYHTSYLLSILFVKVFSIFLRFFSNKWPKARKTVEKAHAFSTVSLYFTFCMTIPRDSMTYLR